MNSIDRGQAVEVNIGGCRCHGDPRPHPDGDVVYLRPKPDLAMGLAATSALRQAGNLIGDNEAALYSVFVRYGVIGWNVLGPDGQTLPVTHDAILDRLGWEEGGAIVATRAVALYRDKVLDPLLLMNSAPRPPTPVNGSTPQSPSSGRSRTSRKPSSHSGPVATQ